MQSLGFLFCFFVVGGGGFFFFVVFFQLYFSFICKNIMDYTTQEQLFLSQLVTHNGPVTQQVF